jgi:hypothetical protein
MGMSHAQLVRQYGYARLTRWLKEYTNIFYGRASEEVKKKEPRMPNTPTSAQSRPSTHPSAKRCDQEVAR